MAIQGISLSERNWFVCSQDPGKRDTLEESLEAGATVFYWKAIPSTVMTRIHDMVASSTMELGGGGSQTFHQRTAARNREAFRFGVSAWDNFFDEKDEAIVYEAENVLDSGRAYTVAKGDAVDRCRLGTINEVGAHIFNANSMGDEQRKKFEDVLSQLGGLETGPVANAVTQTNDSEDVTDPPNTPTEKQTSQQTPTPKQGKSTRAK